MIARREIGWAVAMVMAVGTVGCNGTGPTNTADQPGDTAAASVSIDGSSTVAPIIKATAELFSEKHKNVRVSVGISGTGGGFKKFLENQASLRTDISNASRPIKTSERERAAQIGVEYIELPIALDGIAVVVNRSNDFCDHLTLGELRTMWLDPQISSWRQVRDGFPDVPLRLYGPGTDSGTYDYFVEAVTGGTTPRSDFSASESDNVLVQGVSGDAGALGYFGFSYYEQNESRLKLLAIDSGSGPIRPSLDSIRDATYSPLARPLYLYVQAPALDRPAVAQFLDFLFEQPAAIVEHPRVGYVALTPELYQAARTRLKQRVLGSVYTDDASHARPLGELYLPKP